jgi:hypothetical protein
VFYFAPRGAREVFFYVESAAGDFSDGGNPKKHTALRRKVPLPKTTPQTTLFRSFLPSPNKKKAEVSFLRL